MGARDGSPAAIGQARGECVCSRSNRSASAGRAVPAPSPFALGKTNAEGSFVFERVPPIPSCIDSWLHFSAPSPLKSSQSAPLHLEPGATFEVALGGKGIDVKGQLVAENQPANFDYHFALNYLVAKRPGIESPQSLAGKISTGDEAGAMLGARQRRAKRISTPWSTGL